MTNYKIERGVAIQSGAIEANPWNPNKTSPRVQQAIAESLENYGQIVELLVRPHPEIAGKYQIIDGEHRFSELSKSDKIVYANVIHGLPDVEAKKLTIILNETRGMADKIELSSLLADISETLGDDAITGLPYSEGELDRLIELSKFDWEEIAEPDSKKESDDNDSKWVQIQVKMPEDAMDVIKQAYDLIAESRDGLNQDKAIAWGQVIESLAADYLATPQ